MTQQPPSPTRPARPGLSFEFFPPKTAKMEETLWATIEALAPLAPGFVSVTYGAGGSTRERTHETVARIVRETELVPAAHLTCVSATRGEIDEVVHAYAEAGVRHIVALRGDPPGGVGGAYEPHPGGYPYAADLVAGIAAIGGFDISVGAYPERHPESGDWRVEIDNLKRKIDAGASRAITQFFFDDDAFERFLDRCVAAGIGVPILPGIIPIHDFAAVSGFAAKTGTSMPKAVAERFEKVGSERAERAKAAIDFGRDQVADLARRGVTEFHFYTMNRADLVTGIVEALGITPKA